MEREIRVFCLMTLERTETITMGGVGQGKAFVLHSESNEEPLTFLNREVKLLSHIFEMLPWCHMEINSLDHKWTRKKHIRKLFQ